MTVFLEAVRNGLAFLCADLIFILLKVKFGRFSFRLDLSKMKSQEHGEYCMMRSLIIYTIHIYIVRASK
jgi:hypothetical protein